MKIQPHSLQPSHSPEDAHKSSLFKLLRNANVPFLSLILVVFAVLTFLPALQNDFINFDDQPLITDNAIVQSGLSLKNVAYAFGNVVGYNWHPLTVLSHMLDCQLFGLQPWGHHLTNVLLHALTTLLVFLVFRKMTGATWRCFFVAAVFGLHPLRVESVAWVAERKDVLSTLFWMLTLWAYMLFAEKSGRGARSGVWYGLTLVFFCLGLMAKPMLVTLPCVLLLLDYWPLNRFGQKNVWRLVGEKAPFFLFSILVCAITFLVQQNEGAMRSFSLAIRLENSAVAYCRYLGKTLWPQDLCLPYPHPGNWPMSVVIISVVTLAGVSAFAVMTRRSRPYFLVGWLWFLGTLVPVIGIVQVGSQSMADRYSYIPSLGILLFLTWGVCDLTKRWQLRPAYLSAAAVAAIVSCVALSREQLSYWKNSGTLFSHTVRVTQNNSLACLLLADDLNARGNYEEALKFYRQSLAAGPWNVTALNNYGLLLQQLGKFDEAAVVFEKALGIEPENVNALNNYGLLLQRLGKLDEATVFFEKGLKLKPADSQMHNNLGAVMAQGGHFDQAILHFEKAAELDPGSASARANLGIALEKAGHHEQAVAQLEKALLLQPDSAFIHAKLAETLAGMGKFEEAAKHYEQGIRLDPTSSQAQCQFARVLLQLAQFNEAADHFREALRLEPGNAEAERELRALTHTEK